MEKLKIEEVEYPFLEKPLRVIERENGHKIVLGYKHGGICNISSWVKTGSINEDDEINGISHFVEHVMFKGTKTYKAGYFDKTLEAKGAIVNAATWKDYTFYYVTLPYGKNGEDFKLAIKLHADMMLNPIFPEEELGLPFDYDKEIPEVKRERSVVIEEIGMCEDNPWTKVYNQCNQNMYTQHPYKRDVIGKRQIISSIPQEKIMEYYLKFYTPNNITTIAVGDFDEDEILELFLKEFDFQERKNSLDTFEYQIDEPKKAQFFEKYGNVTTGFMMYGFLGPKACEAKEIIALDMISIILGEGISSRLHQNLIENAKESVFNMVSSCHYQFKDGSNFFIQANFKPEKKELAIELINNEIRKINEMITQKEFNKARKKLISSFASDAETVSSIAETIGDYMTKLNDIKPVNDYLKMVNNLSIENLIEVAKKYINLDFATISVLMPDKNKKKENE